MSYEYARDKLGIFTEDGQATFLKVRDNVKRLTEMSGCFHMVKAWSDVTGDCWMLLACVDRLVELGELHEVAPGRQVKAQYRVFEAVSP